MNLVTSKVLCHRTKKQKEFYKFEFPSWVNVVAKTPERKILLIRQYRFGSNKVEIEIPGGVVNTGEPPLDAGIRELLEETGFKGENERIIGSICPNPAIQHNLCYTVFVENAKKIARPHLDEMEDIDVFLMEEEELFSLIKKGELSHGLVLNGLMFYLMENEKLF